ncbi:MAG TPA: Y-family DNA polymerase [Chloroflexota bacterium]
MSSVLALIDCRSFYVSVERVWDQMLRHKPVVVLGNNDSTIVALSDEAKAIGLRRGTPIFEVRNLIEQHQVVCFSSNYALYADFSERVRQSLLAFAASPARLETYSIDEWWLDASHIATENLVRFGREIRSTILQHVGLATGVTLAPTKTLTKIAGEIVKKYPEYMGVLALVATPKEELDEWLSRIAIDDIWMVGRKRAEQLNDAGIYTARQLRDAELSWIHRKFTVVTARTVLELRGVPCIPLEPLSKPKKNIASAKTFGRPIERLESLCQAISAYIARAAEKLRSQSLVAMSVSVFITTNRFNTSLPQYSNSASKQLLTASAFTPDLVAAALDALRSIFRLGFAYTKAGVFLSQISAKDHIQPDLFGVYNAEVYARKERIVAAVDRINHLFGPDTIFFGSMGLASERTWRMRQEHLSKHYTTRWQEILEVNAR